MCCGYRQAMFDVGDSLRPGLIAAQAHLRDAQSALAHANADGGSSRSADAAMAKTAEAAIFEEALLGAVHARLSEIKTVSK